MKITDLKPGTVYYDGKDGLRKILAFDGARVTYELLAAKATSEWSHEEGKFVSVLGRHSEMTAAAFATWAKSAPAELEMQQIEYTLRAKKIKLSPGEAAYVRSAMSEANGTINAGLCVEILHNESRTADGLAKKGIIVRHTGEAEFTAVGAAWAVLHAGK